MGKVVLKDVEEARNQLPSLLDETERGHATLISRGGQAVAALIPMSTYEKGLAGPQQSLLQLEGSARGLWERNTECSLQKLRDEWDR